MSRQDTAMQKAIAHYEQLSLNGSNQAYVVAEFLKQNFLPLEKQQIIKAIDYCRDKYIDSENYYNEKYGK